MIGHSIYEAELFHLRYASILIKYMNEYKVKMIRMYICVFPYLHLYPHKPHSIRDLELCFLKRRRWMVIVYNNNSL